MPRKPGKQIPETNVSRISNAQHGSLLAHPQGLSVRPNQTREDEADKENLTFQTSFKRKHTERIPLQAHSNRVCDLPFPREREGTFCLL